MAPSLPHSYHSSIDSEPKVGGIKELIRLWSGVEVDETPISSNWHRRKSAVTTDRDLQKLVQRLLTERSNEIQVLKNKQFVSMFLHRKKIENCLLYKSVKNNKVVVDDLLPQSAQHELDQIQRAISFWSLREIFNNNPQPQTSSHQREQEQQQEVGGFWTTETVSSEYLQVTNSQQSDISWEEPSESLAMTKIERYSDNNIKHDVFSTDNSEIVELLHRRTVSESLASGFQEKLSKAVLSSLKRHQQRATTKTTTTTEEDEAYDDDRSRSRSNLGFSQMDVVLDMRSDIANLHNEMSELRKLFVGFMEKNGCSQNIEAAKMSFCCVCSHKQIDSLIYRCGHMCTCFKCANDLKTNTGKCPVCATPIVDVVRTHTYSDQ